MAESNTQEIKDKLNVVDVISNYIPVKKAGGNYKASCPFHNEKTASLMISVPKQIWHCFGCGEGGDIFRFVMRYENIEFREALQILADQAGVVLRAQAAGPSRDKNVESQLLRINAFAAKFYQKYLEGPLGQEARNYLASRRLTGQTIMQWGIGLAPDGFSALLQALSQKGVSVADGVQAGVLGQSEQGKPYDRFRNRIMFPIANTAGDIVGFTARVFHGETDQAKYINSPDSVIYNKSKVIFGLHLAKTAIRQQDSVVVVEGQMDCISLHQAGFTNTVATSGTALTEDHLRQLSRLTKHILFCFDADSAGQRAARRAGEMALDMGIQVKLISITPAKDPDELVTKSPQLWQKAVSDAHGFIDYYIERAQNDFGAGSLEQAQYVSRDIVPLLQKLSDPVEQDYYLRRLSTTFRVTESALRMQLRQVGAQQRSGASTKPVAPLSTTNQAALHTTEKRLLGGVITYPKFRDFVLEQGLAEYGLPEDFKPLFVAALTATLTPEQLAADLAKEAVFMVESELEYLQHNELALEREFHKSFYSFQMAAMKQRQRELTLQLKQAEQDRNQSLITQYNQEFLSLTTQRQAVERALLAL